MTEVAVYRGAGGVALPSQVSTYMTCPAKWYFRYLVGLSEPATGGAGPGISRDTGAELPPEAEYRPRHREWRIVRSLACGRIIPKNAC
jgi:hypothetical protein